MDKDCPSCRHYLEDELLLNPVCEHPVHFGSKTIRPSCSTARDEHWWGKQACGPDARYYEPCE